MRLYKDTYRNKDGEVKKTSKWYLDFRDHLNRRHYLAGFRDKKVTWDLAGQIESLISYRVSGQSLPPELQRWLENVPDAMKNKFVKWSLVDAQRIEGGKLLTAHLNDWKKSIIATGSTEKQADQQYTRASRVFTESRFLFWKNIKASKLLITIESLQKLQRTKNGVYKNTEKPTSPRTKHHHLGACKQFARWMMADRRANDNPIEYLNMTGKIEVQEPRRALNIGEIEILFDYITKSKPLSNIPGHERILLYRFAMETGLRANEIRTLTRLSFNFEAPTVKVEPKHTKNGKAAILPLKPSTADAMRKHTGYKAPTAPVFRMPKSNLAKMLQKDIANARKHWIEDAKDNPEEHRKRTESDFLKIKTSEGKLVFHSLRNSFASFLESSGASPKVAQELMRHSTVQLTLGLYTKLQTNRVSDAVNALPDFGKQESVKTGTDNSIVDAIGDVKSSPFHSPTKHSKHSNTLQNIAKQGDNVAQRQNPVTDNNNGVFSPKTERRGFEPPEAIVSLRRFSKPLP
jgi:integrase